eukprot:scaffold1267_cov171-Amphora_coffeaeformis.AAC.15
MKAQAVYMPCLEFLMLLQFWCHWDKLREQNVRPEPNTLAAVLRSKYIIAAICVPIWVAVILVQVIFEGSPGYLEWCAVVLWSLETFPQLWTNINDTGRSVSGQSVVSILITIVGKTTDSLATYLLVMPMQYKVVAFFSSTSAWLNAFMVMVAYARFYDLHNASVPEVTRSIGSTMQERNDDQLDAQMIDSLVIETEMQSRAKEHDYETNMDDHSGVGVSYCRDLYNPFGHSSLLQSMEYGIRRSLATSYSLRFFTATLLSILMMGVVVACFLTIHNPWIVLLMICVSGTLIASFHYFRSRCDSTSSEIEYEDIADS